MSDAVRVLGVDACKAGWIGVTLTGGAVAAADVAPTIGALVDQVLRTGPLEVVAIDIPIGLPDRGRRRADELAKAAVGPLRSSVFMTPVRSALQAADHATAVRVNRELAGEGVSIQAHGLRTKLFEVEHYVRSSEQTVIEVHPEVCFARMNGGPLSARKSSWAGAETRRALLARHGITLSGGLGHAGMNAGVDDVLDAAAAAWSAARYVAGCAVCHPNPPEIFSDGWRTAIWA